MDRKQKKRKSYFIIKRIFDVSGALTGLLITFPIWVITVIGIELSDPGPVFYKARRVGEGNREFLMYKFRSMRQAKDANEKSFKADVNRIFRFGEWIRKMKIDELPQLLNILFGDMSIVGPRPASVDQADRVRAGRYALASCVKPGLTGPSALYDYLYGDYIEDEDEYEKMVLPDRLELDVYYVRKRSLGYDLRMIIYTVICICNTALGHSSDQMLEEFRSCAEYSRTKKIKNKKRM